MKVEQFVKTALDIEKNYKTLYAMGGIGMPLNEKNKVRLLKNAYNKTIATRINSASSNTFAFDCVCLIKSILWGWCGDVNKTYGGAVYESNGVPDIGANEMIKRCIDVSTDFSQIAIGEAVWMSGHIGIYVGNGKVVEATSAWEGKVIMSDIDERGNRSRNGKKASFWIKHGFLPYVDYTNEELDYKKLYDEQVEENKKLAEINEELKKRIYGAIEILSK